MSRFSTGGAVAALSKQERCRG